TFQAGAQGTTSINYTLPITAPTANQASPTMLAATGVSGSAVTLGWASAASAPLFAVKSSYQDYTTTSLVSDNDLSVSLVSGATYIFEAFLSFTDESGDQTQAKIGFAAPTGTFKFGWNCSADGANTYSTVVNSAGSASNTIQIANNNSSYETFVHVKGIIITTASGTLQLECERVAGTTLRLQAD